MVGKSMYDFPPVIGMNAVGKFTFSTGQACLLSREWVQNLLAPKPPWPRGTGTKSLDQSLKIAGRRTECNNSRDCKALVP